MHKMLWIIEDLLQIKGLSKAYAPLLSELLKYKSLSGSISITASIKREIGTTIDSTVGSIDNILSKLVESDIIIRVDRAMYKLCTELEELSNLQENEVKMLVIYKDNKKNIKIGG